MKVAEALALRADLQRRLEQLKQRLVKNARIQEGDKPEEDSVELQSELEKSADVPGVAACSKNNVHNEPPEINWTHNLDAGGVVSGSQEDD